MEFKGKVKKIFTKEFDKKDGTKGSSTEIWVEEEANQYPQSGVFEVGQKATAPKEGELVTIQFSMSTNEWQDKVFGKNRAWKIESERTDNEPIGKITEKEPDPVPDFLKPKEGEADKDGLPF